MLLIFFVKSLDSIIVDESFINESLESLNVSISLMFLLYKNG